MAYENSCRQREPLGSDARLTPVSLTEEIVDGGFHYFIVTYFRISYGGMNVEFCEPSIAAISDGVLEPLRAQS